MKKVCVMLVVLTLAACERSAPTDTVDSLVANPERLSKVQRLCKDDPVKTGNAECAAASEAYRRRFMGDSKTQYTARP
jgi:Conjugative transfer region protein TrbK